MKGSSPTVSEKVQRLVERCACCRAALVPEMTVVIVGGRFSTWSPQVEQIRGQVVEVQTPRVGHALAAVTPRAGTSAHAAGYDVLFVVCSRACRDRLDEALRGVVLQLAMIEPAGTDSQRIN